MAQTMLGAALREITGLLEDLFAKLSGENGQEWLDAFKKFLRRENPWPVKEVVEEVKQALLALITTVATTAVDTFKAKDRFKVGEVKGVKIGWLGDNFKENFLSGKGKIETAVTEAILRVHKLIKASVDTPIIAELSGEEVAETTLAQMWQMLAKQGHGEDGPLLTNGYWNIFYVRDAKGTLWAVSADWYSGFHYWSVEAYSVTDPNTWNAEGQVVSR